MNEINKDIEKTNSLISKVINDVNQRISDRKLGSGARLPSIRVMANLMNVSTTTVVEAYNRLVARGVITSRRGAGYYVKAVRPKLGVAENFFNLNRPIDSSWLIRQSFDSYNSIDGIQPGCCWLPSTWMEEETIRKCMRSTMRDNFTNITDYSSSYGHTPLRQLIAYKLIEKGIEVNASQIILTNSSTHSIDLLCRFLLKYGDTVVVDDPCYFNFTAILNANKANIVRVPYTKNGPDINALEKVFIMHSPSLYITNSTFHNPTGASMTNNTAREVCHLASKYNVFILEDDVFSDLEQIPSARLAVFAGLQQVAYVGSFSKTLSATIRCGYIAIREDWIDEVVNLKLATSLSSSHCTESLIYKVLTEGGYHGHVESLIARLSHSASLTTQALIECGLTPWIDYCGGIYIWASLPNKLDAVKIAKWSLKRGVMLSPGKAFSQSQVYSSYLRFNVSQSLDRRVFQILSEAIKYAKK
jgi:DNA-binding transcriptional MocR family regulator